jgi:hypothetical protein
VDTNMVVLVLGEFALVGFILWLLMPVFQEKARRRAELQGRVLERFGSAREFIDFLGTDDGRRFQEWLSGRRGTPHTRILSAVQAGLVLVALGLGLFLASLRMNEDELFTGSAVAASLGLGFLASAWASYRLSKAWGLLTPETSDESRARRV